jgi:hypothetical protein
VHPIPLISPEYSCDFRFGFAAFPNLYIKVWKLAIFFLESFYCDNIESIVFEISVSLWVQQSLILA